MLGPVTPLFRSPSHTSGGSSPGNSSTVRSPLWGGRWREEPDRTTCIGHQFKGCLLPITLTIWGVPDQFPCAPPNPACKPPSHVRRPCLMTLRSRIAEPWNLPTRTIPLAGQHPAAKTPAGTGEENDPCARTCCPATWHDNSDCDE